MHQLVKLSLGSCINSLGLRRAQLILWSIKSKVFLAEVLPSCVSLACSVDYLNLKAVLYPLPFKGQTCWFQPSILASCFPLWFQYEGCVICKADESLSLLHSLIQVSAKNVDQRLSSKVNSPATAVSSTFKPDNSEEVMPFDTHREKGNCKLLPIIHSSWK